MKFVAALLLLLGLPPAALCQQNDGSRPEVRPNGRTAALTGLEGKPPPPLNGVNWVNTGGKALTWSNLRGKVVLLSFWDSPC